MENSSFPTTRICSLLHEHFKLQKVQNPIRIDSATRGVAAVPDSPTERLSPCSTIASAHASVMVNRANYITARAPTPCLLNSRSHHGRQRATTNRHCVARALHHRQCTGDQSSAGREAGTLFEVEKSWPCSLEMKANS